MLRTLPFVFMKRSGGIQSVILLALSLLIWYRSSYDLTCNCASQMPEPEDYCKKERFVNMLVADSLDIHVYKKFQDFSVKKADANNPELIEIAKVLMDTPNRISESPKFAQQPLPTPQTKTIDKVLNSKTSGLFIECGGYDGEVSSPTSFLEVKQQWSGLLIEADPYYYTQLMGKRRNVFSINACLSPNSYYSQMNFTSYGGQIGRISNNGETDRQKKIHKSRQKHVHTIPCFPLETLFRAIGWTDVDFFSLDVEGLEMDILKSINFQNTKFQTLSVEYLHNSNGIKDYLTLMQNSGYSLVQDLKYRDLLRDVHIHDLIFNRTNIVK